MGCAVAKGEGGGGWRPMSVERGAGPGLSIATSLATGLAIEIRALTELAEFERCVELRIAVWGYSDGDVIPAADVLWWRSGLARRRRGRSWTARWWGLRHRGRQHSLMVESGLLRGRRSMGGSATATRARETLTAVRKRLLGHLRVGRRRLAISEMRGERELRDGRVG